MEPCGSLEVALTAARRTYTGVMDSTWGQAKAAMHKNGAYEDGDGKLVIDAQTGRIQSSVGGEVAPIPATTANSVDCQGFFGKIGVPFCKVTARKTNASKYAIIAPPAFAGYGDIEVHHWNAIEVDKYAQNLAGAGYP